MPKNRPHKKNLSWLARTAIKTGRIVPKRIQIGKEPPWLKDHRRKISLAVPIGRRRKGRYRITKPNKHKKPELANAKPVPLFAVTKKNPNKTEQSTKTYNQRGKIVSVSYPKRSFEGIGRTIARMRKKPTQELIERKAQREAKKWFLERRKYSQSSSYIKGRQNRWIREQAVGMALREVGVFSKSIRKKVHELYSKLLEYETKTMPRKSKISSEKAQTAAKEKLKKLLGGKFTRFNKARSRYSGKLRTALRKEEKRLARK